MEDLSGRIFGRLTVIDYAGNYKWNCQCSCGNKTVVAGGDLRSGCSQSCGCLRKQMNGERLRAKLTGKRFGRLTVLEFAGTENNQTLWKCKCDCGNEVIVKGHYLTCGDTKSCGCLMLDRIKETNTVHGLSYKSRLYDVWKGMRSRCNNPNHIGFKDYGGRGISVCDEWNDYANFYNWAMANGFDEQLPTRLCSLDRIDNNGDYSPSNCRWISYAQQSRNTRKTRMLEYHGQTKPLLEWSDIFGLAPNIIRQRIDKSGWSVAEALTTPLGARRGYRRAFRPG